ncbi:MAG: DUF4404 family protein [Thermodesulfobacteriota bacterium]
MSREKVNELIKGLHEEIHKLKTNDEPAKNRIEELVIDLENQLENSEGNFENEDILDSLTHLIEQLEIEHPQITALLSKLSMTLSNMGI